MASQHYPINTKNSEVDDNAIISVLQNLPTGVIIFSATNILFINKAALKILNVSQKLEKEIYKSSIFDFLLPEYHQRIKENNIKILNKEEFIPLELKIKNFKNKVIDIEVKSNAINFKGAQAIQTVFTDVSERVKYRTQLEVTKQELENTKIQFDHITQNANDIIYYYSYYPEPKYLFISPSVNNVLGYSEKEFYKNPNFGSSLVKNKNDFLQNENKLITHQKSKKFTTTTSVFQYKTKHKGLIWLEDRYSPIYDSEGNIKYILGISRDITKEKENNIEIERINNSYKNLINSAPIGIFIHQAGTCLFANIEACKILQVKNPDLLIDKNLIDFIVPEQRKSAIKRMKSALKGEYLDYKTYTIVTAKKKKIEVELKTSHLIFNNISCVQTIITNITAEKKLQEQTIKTELVEQANKLLKKEIEYRNSIEQKLLNQTQKLESIFESSSHLIWTVDKEFKLTSCNNNFIKTFKFNNQVCPILNKQLHLLLPKDKQEKYVLYWYNLYNKVLKGNSLKFERTQFDKEGKQSVKEIYLNPVRNKDNEIIEIACLAHDITENKLFEKQLLEQSAKLKAIFESGDQLMWTITKDGVLTSFNQNYANSIYDLYEYYPEVGKSMRSSKTKNFHSIWDKNYDIAFSGKQVEFISERTTLSGKNIIRQIFLYPIFDAKNTIIEVSGIGFDITENKKNEEKISQSLKEKEILLKEVHHRVKNNMQVITSILSLQSSYVKDQYALDLLKECQNRIKSMAFIHESLYQTKNFEEVNFSEYISILTKNLVHTYSVNIKNVKLVLNVCDLYLNLDLSIPCGLIINEIISNSLKYAFPHKKAGIIFVNLTIKNKTVNLEIGDNGVGIPNDLNIKESQTLGLQLVDTLIEQINGTLTLHRVNGTKFLIEFNI